MRSVSTLVVVLVVGCVTVPAATGTRDRASQPGRFEIASTHSSGSQSAPIWSPAQTAPLAAPVTEAQYHARAAAICTGATKKFQAVWRRVFPTWLTTTKGTLAQWAVWHRAAARFAEQSLHRLRGLAPPRGYGAQVSKWLSLAQQEADVLRQAAAAAAVGNRPRFEALGGRRVNLTHRKDAVGALPGNCPVALPA